MIRKMRQGEEGHIRALLAELSYEDQILWRKQPRPLREHLEMYSETRISEENESRNFLFVAEEDGRIVGFCWCSITDRGVDKQGEIAEFYVEKPHRGKGIGQKLLEAAKHVFAEEKAEVAFIWTHKGNQTAIELYKNAGFKEVDQVVMAFIPTKDRHSQARH